MGEDMEHTQAFDGLAENYRRFRPDYPREAVAGLVEYVRRGAAVREGALVLDVGAGTGISTRALRDAFGPGPRIVGVEPGERMRESAAVQGGEGLEFRSGTAESLPAEDGSASLVLAAQAVHWFDRPAFFGEAVRVLCPGGALAVLQNDRDWRGSLFLDEYEGLLEQHGNGYDRRYREYDLSAELDRVEGLHDPGLVEVPWAQTLTAEEFAGRALSSTKVQDVVRNIGEERALTEIHALLERYGDGDQVRVPYVTRLFLRRRAAPPG